MKFITANRLFVKCAISEVYEVDIYETSLNPLVPKTLFTNEQKILELIKL